MTGLRIIDLGCHDGFIASWLIAQAKAQGIPIERYDGVELQPQAAEIAQARIRQAGIPGEIRAIAAEDAPEAFGPPASATSPAKRAAWAYDLVLAFEIIEHVPDVEKFLQACEALAGGRGIIALSTPDGCFGEGRNPHHLRTYRAVDLGNLIRRRGRMLDLQSGRDGIASIAYKPAARRGEIAIYTGPGWEPWAPQDIARKGLGGSETAAVRLAEELDDRGWVVSVYGS